MLAPGSSALAAPAAPQTTKATSVGPSRRRHRSHSRALRAGRCRYQADRAATRVGRPPGRLAFPRAGSGGRRAAPRSSSCEARWLARVRGRLAPVRRRPGGRRPAARKTRELTESPSYWRARVASEIAARASPCWSAARAEDSASSASIRGATTSAPTQAISAAPARAYPRARPASGRAGSAEPDCRAAAAARAASVRPGCRCSQSTLVCASQATNSPVPATATKRRVGPRARSARRGRCSSRPCRQTPAAGRNQRCPARPGSEARASGAA